MKRWRRYWENVVVLVSLGRGKQGGDEARHGGVDVPRSEGRTCIVQSAVEKE